MAFKKWCLSLPSYLPAFLMLYDYKVNYYQLVMKTRFTERSSCAATNFISFIQQITAIARYVSSRKDK